MVPAKASVVDVRLRHAMTQIERNVNLDPSEQPRATSSIANNPTSRIVRVAQAHLANFRLQAAVAGSSTRTRRRAASAVARYVWLVSLVVGCAAAIVVILDLAQEVNRGVATLVGLLIGLILFSLWQAWEEPRLGRRSAARLKAPIVWNGYAVLVFARGDYVQTIKSRFGSPSMIGGWCYVDDEHVSFVPTPRMQHKGAKEIRIPLAGVVAAQVTRKWQLTGRHAHQLQMRTLSGEVAIRVLEPAGSLPTPFSSAVANG
jgi:hypothetical protein